MKQKNLLILALLAIVLVALGVVVSHKQGSEKKLADGGLLVPDLRGAMDKVEDIRVVTRKGDAVTQVSLQKKAGQWLVSDRNYRADTQKLATLMNALMQAKRIEAKTSKPDNYGKLGVVDPTKVDPAKADPAKNGGAGSGTLLRLLAADGEPHLELIIGIAAQGRRGQYVRIAHDAQAWLADQTLQLPVTSAEWLDHKIVDISPQDIVAVDFGTLTLKRPAPDKALELNAIPPGRELSYEGVTATAAAALSQLQLQDVAAATAITLDKPVAAALFVKTNSTIAVKAYRQSGKNYLALSAVAAENADDAARKQVDTWNAAWQPWVFEVETFTYNKFVKSINDFTKEKSKVAKTP